MTIIRSNKSHLLENFILVFLVLVLFGSAGWLVSGYNYAVNLDYALEGAKNDIEKVNVKAVESRDRILNLLSGNELDEFVASRGLVGEKDPNYLQASIAKQWEIASR